MSHLDPDVAALLALGEDVADEQQQSHLAHCAECAAEVEAFRRTVAAGRRGAAPALLQPPARVWDAIADELELGHDASQHPGPELAAPTAPPAPPMHVAPRGRGRRGRRALLIGLVASAAAVAVVAGVWSSGILTTGPIIVSEASLASFPDWEGAEGEAVLEEIDGHHRVVVRLDADLPDDGHREVWLLTEDASALVSLGVLTGAEGEFPLPDDVDVSRFTVVDVSQEADDGDPAHSGDSIVRGQLSPA